MAFDPRSIEHLNIFIPGNLELKIVNQLEWTKANRAIKELPKAIHEGYEDAVGDFSRDLINTIRKMMESGDPSWAPLSPSTLESYHKKYPAANHPWYRSGFMSSRVDFYSDEHSNKVYIGLPQYQYYEPQDWGEDSRRGLTMMQLAKMLEFGSWDGRIPARPLFSTAFDRKGGRNKLRENILKYLKRRLAKLGFTGVH